MTILIIGSFSTGYGLGSTTTGFGYGLQINLGET